MYERFDSSDGRVMKYVFDYEDAIAEVVLYRYPDFETRTVICCSVQCGCPVGCTFCGTGGSFVRNLTTAEIISQVCTVLNEHGIVGGRVANLQIMFMSQGEPFLNATNVFGAIEWLHSVYPNADLLMSTIGPDVSYQDLGYFVFLSRRIPKLGLQVYVHASTDGARNALIPFTQKMTLRELAAYGEWWSMCTGRRPFFNYCVTVENSSKADANQLADLFRPHIWECILSVVCEPVDRQLDLIKLFSSKMLHNGYSVRVLNPAGQDDIGGGCGQLWYVQDWMKARREKSLPPEEWETIRRPRT